MGDLYLYDQDSKKGNPYYIHGMLHSFSLFY